MYRETLTLTVRRNRTPQPLPTNPRPLLTRDPQLLLQIHVVRDFSRPLLAFRSRTAGDGLES